MCSIQPARAEVAVQGDCGGPHPPLGPTVPIAPHVRTANRLPTPLYEPSARYLPRLCAARPYILGDNDVSRYRTACSCQNSMRRNVAESALRRPGSSEPVARQSAGACFLKRVCSRRWSSGRMPLLASLRPAHRRATLGMKVRNGGKTETEPRAFTLHLRHRSGNSHERLRGTYSMTPSGGKQRLLKVMLRLG